MFPPRPLGGHSSGGMQLQAPQIGFGGFGLRSPQSSYVAQQQPNILPHQQQNRLQQHHQQPTGICSSNGSQNPSLVSGTLSRVETNPSLHVANPLNVVVQNDGHIQPADNVTNVQAVTGAQQVIAQQVPSHCAIAFASSGQAPPCQGISPSMYQPQYTARGSLQNSGGLGQPFPYPNYFQTPEKAGFTSGTRIRSPARLPTVNEIFQSPQHNNMLGFTFQRGIGSTSAAMLSARKHGYTSGSKTDIGQNFAVHDRRHIPLNDETLQTQPPQSSEILINNTAGHVQRIDTAKLESKMNKTDPRNNKQKREVNSVRELPSGKNLQSSRDLPSSRDIPISAKDLVAKSSVTSSASGGQNSKSSASSAQPTNRNSNKTSRGPPTSKPVGSPSASTGGPSANSAHLVSASSASCRTPGVPGKSSNSTAAKNTNSSKKSVARSTSHQVVSSSQGIPSKPTSRFLSPQGSAPQSGLNTARGTVATVKSTSRVAPSVDKLLSEKYLTEPEKERLLQEEATRLQKEIHVLAGKQQALEGDEIPQLDTVITAMSEKLAHLRKEHEEIEDQVDKQTDQHQRFLRRHEDVSKELACQDKVNEEELQKEKKHLEETRLAPARDQRTKLVTEEEDLKRQLTKEEQYWNGEITKHGRIHKEAVIKRDKVLKDLDETIKNLNEHLKKTITETGNLKGESNSLRNEKSRLDKEIESIRQQIEAALQDVQKFYTETSQAEHQLREFQNVFDKKSDTLQVIRRNYAEVSASLANLQEDQKHVEEGFREAEEKLHATQEESNRLALLIDDVRTLHSKIQEMRMKKRVSYDDAIRMSEHVITPSEMLLAFGNNVKDVYSMECQSQAEKALLDWYQTDMGGQLVMGA